MKILVAIPSHKREKSILKETLSWVHKLTGDDVDVKVFVEPQEFVRYMPYIQALNRQNESESNLKKIGLVKTEDGAGLSGQMRRIGEYAKENGYSYVVKLDDDMYVTGWKKGDRNEKYNKPKSHIALRQFIDESIELMEQTKAESKPIGGVGMGVGSYTRWNKEDKTILKENTPLYFTYLTVPEALTEFDKNNLIFVDVWISLIIHRMGMRTVMHGRSSHNGKMYTNAGGISTKGRDEIAKRSAVHIKDQFPEIKVTKHDKYGWTDIEISEALKAV